MSISLDHDKAQQILFTEVDAARAGSASSEAEAWRSRVAHLGELCPHGRSATVIAALGTAILAKATDPRVDVYSLLDRGEADNSYSARSLADNVWARHRARLNIDLGANGVNPLNNTPFIGKTRIDEITGVRNQVGWQAFIECIEALQKLATEKEVREALRGFIIARTRGVLTPLDIAPQAGDDLTSKRLVQLIERYVSERSEGGRRAQACAAAILDATYGEHAVVVGVINDPDRRAPLDVSVTDDEMVTVLAVEVKDKPIEGHHVTASIEKTVATHTVRNLCFLAVSKDQRQTDFGTESLWAAQHGVKMTLFLTWMSFFEACKLFAPTTGVIFEGAVYRRILKRAVELAVDADGLDGLVRYDTSG